MVRTQFIKVKGARIWHFGVGNIISESFTYLLKLLQAIVYLFCLRWKYTIKYFLQVDVSNYFFSTIYPTKMFFSSCFVIHTPALLNEQLCDNSSPLMRSWLCTPWESMCPAVLPENLLLPPLLGLVLLYRGLHEGDNYLFCGIRCASVTTLKLKGTAIKI